MEETIAFIKTFIPEQILITEEFKNYKLIDIDVTVPKNLDGFMSTIFFIDLNLGSHNDNNDKKNIKLVLKKIRKDLLLDSETINSFRNEIFIYSYVIPYFNDMIKETNLNFTINDLTPKSYIADFYKFPGSEDKQGILVLENLNENDFRLGPRLHLDEFHLNKMANSIGKFHAFSYAMKLKNDQKLNDFKKISNKIRFIKENDEIQDSNYIFHLSLKRFFKYLDQNQKFLDENEKFHSDMKWLRKNCLNEPYRILHKIREDSIKSDFTGILHGDYLRNNVMFKYKSKDGYENPLSMKMFDFQDTSYGNFVQDVSLFMFFNMDPNLYDSQWDIVFKTYYDSMIKTLIGLMKTNENDSQLKKYSFEKLNEDFKKFGLYGVIISIFFKPWMTANEEDCKKLSDLFSVDMYGEEYEKVAMTCGGVETDEIILSMVKHASELGCFNYYQSIQD